MADGIVVARPYAQAAFEIAKADAQLDSWSAFLRLASEIVLTPDVSRRLTAPGMDLGALAAAIADICRGQLQSAGSFAANLATVTANFLQVLAENRRLATLPDIAARFEVLKAEAENTLEVTLASATAVSDAQQGKIIESLKKRFGRQIRLTVELDPALIGGARLRAGDRVIDGSVRTGLEKLANALQA